MSSLFVAFLLIITIIINIVNFSICGLITGPQVSSEKLESLSIHKDVKIFEIKMSSEMVIEVVSHSVEQLVKYNYTISSAMAQDISAHLTDVYTGSWLVKISSGNVSSSSKKVHKEPYIKFAFKLDTFEIEKEVKWTSFSFYKSNNFQLNFLIKWKYFDVMSLKIRILLKLG